MVINKNKCQAKKLLFMKIVCVWPCPSLIFITPKNGIHFTTHCFFHYKNSGCNCTLPRTCQGFSRSPESIYFQFIKHIFPHFKIKVAKSTLRWARKRLTPLFSAPRQCVNQQKWNWDYAYPLKPHCTIMCEKRSEIFIVICHLARARTVKTF